MTTDGHAARSRATWWARVVFVLVVASPPTVSWSEFPHASADGSPAAVFQGRCARCHGTSGRTDTPAGRPLKVAPLVNDPRLRR